MSAPASLATSGAGALTSRLGRRFVLMFALCALLPLIVFATLSVTRVSEQMNADLRATLHNAAKTSGMGLAARLGQVAGDLRLTADLVKSWRVEGMWSDGEALMGQVRDHCEAVWLFDGDRVETLVGERPAPTLELTEAERAHVARGLPLAHVADGGARLMMVLELDADDEYRTRVVAHVRPQWFWDPQELRGVNCQFAACDRLGRVLFHTFRELPQSQILAAGVTRQASSGSLEWVVDGQPHLARYWHAFLQPQYGIDLWVVQSRSQAEAFAVGNAFVRWFWLTAACTLLCVVLAGLVQMRRTLDPIVSLRDATQRLGRGDLDVRVWIDSNDEFGELGGAFNDMAGRLQENIAKRE
ncbi:MAG: HAMP domain-containing protein, partial [Planctomycetes bacterium]|nr:HAMP domain-containing protein [Planctomycetota bacterium]